MNETWTEIDRFFGTMLIGADPVLEAALAANRAADLPAIDVSLPFAQFLFIVARMIGAERILEIGTLGGTSTIALARALGGDGLLVTLEANPAHAEVATSNIARAGLADRVRLVIGAALDQLPMIEAEGLAPFDLIFIDADKRSNADYLAWAKRLARSGSVIIADNVVRDGRILDPSDADPAVIGTRRLFEVLGPGSGVTATALQTVGVKGWDGFAIGIVE